MDPKVNKEQIIAYLYGESSEEEAQRVEAYLQKHPDAAAEFEAFTGLRKSLNKIPDVEVTQPVIMLDHGRRANGPEAIFRSRFLQKAAAIAAVIILGLLTARLVGLNVRYGDQSLTVAFNEGEAIPTETVKASGPKTNKLSLNEDSMQQLQASINKFFAPENQMAIQRLDSLESTVKILNKKMQHPVAKVSNKATETLPRDMEALARQISQQNLQLFSELLKASQQQQEAYIKSLFSEFSHYIQTQRLEDLIEIETTLKVLKQESELDKLETDEVIARLIQTVNDRDY
ncbi:hypothetical protein QQ020_27785 [Fulvivirgaceae bacterium BMA12]|uniref:Anti-sigma factor n=1 Tax=Agaribacillus aureus TaxID=3051825 RepID=A0ABT8LDP6_9BACT|nr:hypothetical protein [Fulvivirgaceae bacterium BMA12]